MPPLAIAAVGAAASLAGSAIGAASAASDRDAARQAALNAFQQYQNLGTPPDLAMPLVLKNLQQQGILDPQLEQEIKQGPSQLANIQLNSQYQQAQQGALQSLQKQGAGGFTPEEQAQLNQVRSQTAGDAQAQQAALQQQMQSRGIAGGGAELAARLQGQQSSANRESQQGLNIAAMRNQNALQALSQAGQLGGQMQQQYYDINAQKAKAQDIINQFNTQNALSQQQRNVGTSNAAQAQNLAQQQQIANYNTMQGNQEQQRQRQAQQQNWQNQMGLAGAKANSQLGQASYLGGQAAQTANQWQNIGQGVAGSVGAMANMQNQNQFLEYLKSQQQPTTNSTQAGSNTGMFSGSDIGSNAGGGY